jgi:hypothetical protein
MTSWNWPRNLGYTGKEIDAAWEKVDEDWWQGLRPYPSAPDALELLDALVARNRDLQVYFVTGRHPWTQYASTLWLERHGYFAPSVITTSKKAQLAQVFNLEGKVAVMEDKPSLLSAYWLGNSCEHIYRIEQPYNEQNTPGNLGFRTVLGAVQDLAIKWELETETPHGAREAAENV